MNHVRWSDNNCTVGGTCIHGRFTPNDMAWLLSMVPEGYFTNTFHEPEFGWRRITPEKAREVCGEEERGYYFSFMEDEKSQALLVALRLKGFDMKRGEPCF